MEFDFDIRVPKHKEQDDDPVQDYAGITDAARIAKLIGQHRREQLIDAAGTREAGKDVKSSAAIERLERALAEREKLHNEKLHENQTAAAQLEGRLKVAYAWEKRIIEDYKKGQTEIDSLKAALAAAMRRENYLATKLSAALTVECKRLQEAGREKAKTIEAIEQLHLTLDTVERERAEGGKKLEELRAVKDSELDAIEQKLCDKTKELDAAKQDAAALAAALGAEIAALKDKTTALEAKSDTGELKTIARLLAEELVGMEGFFRIDRVLELLDCKKPDIEAAIKELAGISMEYRLYSRELAKKLGLFSKILDNQG